MSWAAQAKQIRIKPTMTPSRWSEPQPSSPAPGQVTLSVPSAARMVKVMTVKIGEKGKRDVIWTVYNGEINVRFVRGMAGSLQFVDYVRTVPLKRLEAKR